MQEIKQKGDKMKITFNGKIGAKLVQSMLTEQEAKKINIIEFCKKNKIDELHYKDSELEFEYHFVEDNKKIEKQSASPKVETRPKQTNAETRKGG